MSTDTPAAAGSSPQDQVGLVQLILRDRLLTVPNIISASRLAMLPVFVWMVVSLEEYAAAAALLAVMGATDWVDGKVARRMGQVSELGKVLDPAADRLVLIASLVVIVVATDAVPAWLWVPVLVREPIMFLSVPTLALLGARRIDVTWYGKAGTFALMTAFPLLLYGAGTAPAAEPVRLLGLVVGAVGLALSYWAAALYIPMARDALREGRAEARAAGI